jgi:magnesium transporter
MVCNGARAASPAKPGLWSTNRDLFTFCSQAFGEVPMIRVIQIASDGTALERTGIEALKNCDDGGRCWVDLEDFDDSELRMLEQRFGLHPLAIEDCRRAQRPKLTNYENYMFMVLHSIGLAKTARTPEFAQLGIFLGGHFLLTLHREPIGAVDEIRQRVLAGPEDLAQGPAYLLYKITDSLMEEIFPVIHRLSDRLLEVENNIVKRADKRELSRLLGLKRAVLALWRVLAAEREVLAVLVRHNNHLIAESQLIYFRDCYDHLVRAYELIDLERDLLGNAMVAYLSTVSNRLGIIMKQLTILSAIFLPPTFITGFFGQNFTALPFDSHKLFFVELVSCVTLPLIMLFWFYRSGWMRSTDAS